MRLQESSENKRKTRQEQRGKIRHDYWWNFEAVGGGGGSSKLLCFSLSSANQPLDSPIKEKKNHKE